MTEDNRNAIQALLRKSLIREFHQDEVLIKEVVEMTEPILELEFEQYMRERDEAREQVRQANLKLEEQQNQLEEQQKELEEQQRQLKAKQKELEALQKQLRNTAAQKG